MSTHEDMTPADSWHTYPSVFALGHRALAELLLDPVIIEEKIDGSQFSFGRFPNHPLADGFRARSRGRELNLAAPETMFVPACATIQHLPLHEGWTYRAEYLAKPRHNTLAYDRCPRQGLILFDVNVSHEAYLPYTAKAEEAARLGVEVVPLLFEGLVREPHSFTQYLTQLSVLGGSTIEGIVVKNYARFGVDKKVLMGKFVSEQFKEKHQQTWRTDNPSSTDIVARLIQVYQSPARWQKALQHLTERGVIEGTPRDIGLLINEIPADIEGECADEIKAALWAWAWPRLRRGVTVGMPEWYKRKLLDAQPIPATEEEG